jgi:serine/threonine-protein kinase
MTSTIAPVQRQMLQEWANTSQTLSSVAQPQMSKSLLKQEFEKLKPKILMKLESIQTGDYSSDISG